MKLLDWIRITYALAAFDLWLDYRGVPRKRRKLERTALRANLIEATARDGSAAAMRELGSPKALAYAVAEAYEHRPRWSVGAMWAGCVFAVMAYALVFSVTAFAEGAMSAGASHATSRTVFPWYGVEFSYTRVEGGFGVGTHLSPWLLIPPFVVFILAAAPWRMLRRRYQPEQPDQH